ncbi:MAG: hypothetical protein AB1782_07655 [Cyanobacteriota bacterium]
MKILKVEKALILVFLVLVLMNLTTNIAIARKPLRSNTGSKQINTTNTRTPVNNTNTTNTHAPANNVNINTTTTNVSANNSIPKPSNAQRQNIAKLKTDLDSIKSGSNVTPAQKQQLAQDFMKLAQGSTKPSQGSVDKLASDLSDAISDKNLTAMEKKKLIDDVYAVLNSANVPPQEIQAVIDDARVVLEASGVDQNDVQLIINDLIAIANEFKNNVPSKQ